MKHRVVIVAIVICALAVPVVASQRQPAPSRSTNRSTRAPSSAVGAPRHIRLAEYRRILEARPIPPLARPGKPLADSIAAFVSRASVSGIGERERIRAMIDKYRGDQTAARALGALAFESRNTDFSKSLTAIAILGEMRNPAGSTLLLDFVRLPLPTQGHRVEGEITERVTQEKLQMKAVDGLAYARTEKTDAEVLRIAASHPSRAVRAEAITAYLFNHPNDPRARKSLYAAVRASERVFIDRPIRTPGMSGRVFNAQLARYLELHPELRPPKPTMAMRKNVIIQRDREKERAMIRRAVLPAPQP